MLDSIDTRLAARSEFAPALLRTGLGVVFLAHTYAKALVFTFPGTEAYFMAHGFPGWTVYPVFASELLGGLALLAGFRTRIVSLLLIPVMLGALRPHLGNGWMFTAAGGGWEYVAFILVALAAQALLGGGAYSLDARLAAEKPRQATGPGFPSMQTR